MANRPHIPTKIGKQTGCVHPRRPTESAAETIARTPPVILIEDHEYACGDFLQTRDYVEAHPIAGLRLWTVKPDLPDICRLLRITVPSSLDAGT